jgi:DNA-binding transcriptional MocR family regulator
VLIVNGAQHGLAAALIATLHPGDVVAVDALTYPGFKVLAQSLHLELAPVPVTAHGTSLDALERLCAARPVRAIYTMPTLHNPLGSVMSESDRIRLAAIARRHASLIIEDASYAYLVENPPAPLAMLAPDVTIYVSGVSKSIAPGLRIGYLAAPAPLVPALERAIRSTTWNTPALTVMIACRWLDDGTVERLEAGKRDDARARQAIARDALAGLPQVSHPASYFVWLPLPQGARADRVAAALAHHHISVSTAEPFATTTHSPQALRLALGSADLKSLPATLRTVARVVSLDAAQ